MENIDRIQMNNNESCEVENKKKFNTDDYDFEFHTEPVVMVQLNPECYWKYMHFINQLAFYCNKDKMFFCLTINRNEVSLIATKKYIEEYLLNVCLDEMGDYNIYLKDYYVIQIYESVEDIGKVGIISYFSTVMSENRIPILYIPTFSNDYLLIESQYIDMAKKVLKPPPNGLT